MSEKKEISFDIYSDSEEMLEQIVDKYDLPDKSKALRCLMDYVEEKESDWDEMFATIRCNRCGWQMKNLDRKLNNFFSNIDALASLIFRFGIGIAFLIHGLNKFPLPPQGLIEYFDLSPVIASTVAISELLSGLILIISGFIKNPIGNLLTRLSGLNISILMTSILIFAHQDWLITTKLFTSEQIFLLIGGIYFLIKGNRA